MELCKLHKWRTTATVRIDWSYVQMRGEMALTGAFLELALDLCFGTWWGAKGLREWTATMLRWNLYIFGIFKHVSLWHFSGWMSTDGCCHTQTAQGRVITAVFSLRNQIQYTHSSASCPPEPWWVCHINCVPLIWPSLIKGLSTSAPGQNSSWLRNTSEKSMINLPPILFVFQLDGAALSNTSTSLFSKPSPSISAKVFLCRPLWVHLFQS